MSAPHQLVVVLGPTASGKSALGVSLAEALNGEVLVCDSTQVYRRFDIGTAKVTAAEERGIPHHLVDMVDADAVFTAGEFRNCAIEALAAVASRGKLPVLTAGTGLYLRALLDGLADVPKRSEELRERLRDSVARRGPEHLHRLLTRLDPASASRIASRDTQKIIRAIEMRVLTGKPVGEIHQSGRNALSGYAVTKIGLAPPRAELYAKIDARTHAMLAAGWLDEVRSLLASGVAPDAKPFQFIGYSALRAHLQGHLPLDEAIANIQRATRQFSKRQMTWFRREKDVHWLEGFGDDPAVVSAALAFVQSSARP
jgi:tRNA dimethylallyltransferase